MILLIDNYDSFTYNVFQLLSELGAAVVVRRNTDVTVEEVAAWKPAGIVISPGPGDPSSAGVSCHLLRDLGESVPILGVCLGHQCVAAAFGARVVRARTLMHGKTSLVYHGGEGLFESIPSPFEAVRYHSLVVERQSLPSTLEVTAQTSDGTVMGIRRRGTRVEGVQFHPESVLTREGPALMRNFLARCGVEPVGSTSALNSQ